MKTLKITPVRSILPEQFDTLAKLIYQSGSELFDYMFGSQQDTMLLLQHACRQQDGQFGHSNHFGYLVHHDDIKTQVGNHAIHNVMSDACQKSVNKPKLIACATLWNNQHTLEFHQQTLSVLSQSLSPTALQKLLRVNDDLLATFRAPLADEFCLGHVSVDEQYKKHGLASALIEDALQTAKQHNKEKLVLDVACDNSPAIACYTKMGFEKQKKNQLPNTQLYFYRMVKFVDEP